MKIRTLVLSLSIFALACSGDDNNSSNNGTSTQNNGTQQNNGGTTKVNNGMTVTNNETNNATNNNGQTSGTTTADCVDTTIYTVDMDGDGVAIHPWKLSV